MARLKSRFAPVKKLWGSHVFIDGIRVPYVKSRVPQLGAVTMRGAALAELSRLLEIPRDYVFAAGDHHNDISMLDGRFARYPACPANAIPEVKNAVKSAGGYVAMKNHGAGVHEALLHFADNCCD